MKSVSAKFVGVLSIAVFVLLGPQPAYPGCELVTATHSAPTRVKAVQTSQALALQSVYNVQRARGWSSVSLSPHPVAGDPFWKAVRPNGVPPKARLEPDIVQPSSTRPASGAWSCHSFVQPARACAASSADASRLLGAPPPVSAALIISQ